MPGAAETGTDVAPAPDAQAAPRTPEDVAARREEIDARNATRRPAPLFSTGSDFPWEAVVTGLSAALLLAAMALFWRIVNRERAPLAATPAGLTPGWTPSAPEGRSPTDVAGDTAASPAVLPPPALSWGERASPPERPASSATPETPGDGWQGWRSSDRDAPDGTSTPPDSN